jgi:hypothetical protein
MIRAAARMAENPRCFLAEHGLRLHQLHVETLEGQPGGQHGMLHVEEPMVQGNQLARLRKPRLCPGRACSR